MHINRREGHSTILLSPSHTFQASNSLTYFVYNDSVALPKLLATRKTSLGSCRPPTAQHRSHVLRDVSQHEQHRGTNSVHRSTEGSSSGLRGGRRIRCYSRQYSLALFGHPLQFQQLLDGKGDILHLRLGLHSVGSCIRLSRSGSNSQSIPTSLRLEGLRLTSPYVVM